MPCTGVCISARHGGMLNPNASTVPLRYGSLSQSFEPLPHVYVFHTTLTSL